MKKIRPPIKVHGGKSYLSSWIVQYFPKSYQEMTYIEPFCGGANVLLNKETSKEEIINDLDANVTTLFRVLRDQLGDFTKLINKVKYNKKTFEKALEDKEFKDDLHYAVNEFILRRMSRGGMKKSYAWSNRLRGNQPGEINAWQTIIKVLPSISERLKNVYVFNKNACEVLRIFDAPEVLCYCDPPYLPETRESPNVYSFEMNLDNHIELADVLNNFQGKVLLSGYPSRLYNRLYKNWTCEKKNVANHASQQKIKPIKSELLWRNF